MVVVEIQSSSYTILNAILSQPNPFKSVLLEGMVLDATTCANAGMAQLVIT